MSTSAVLESLYNALSKRMADSEACEIINEVRDAAIAPLKGKDLSFTKREISNCRACENFEYLNKTAVWNTKDPQALVVLERPSIGQAASKAVTSALDQAGFDKSNTALTYLNRCLPNEGLKYSAVHRKNCFGYLEDEIFAMAPRIVIASGKVVAEALLGPIQQLSKMRGELCYSGNAAVLITFSPLYVVSESSPASTMQTYYDDMKLAASVCKLGE